MPHVTLEYTAGLPAEIATRPLFRRLHRLLADAGGIDIGNCKSRSVAREEHLLGEESADTAGTPWVHLEVRILEGRSRDVTAAVGSGLLEALREAYAVVDPPPQVTVEIREMPKDLYFKWVPQG
ncbi:MAG: 5-carboxymethyl-2-hydroxymuconate Delta-isomerase [Gemmatimonadota bacterium]